MIWKPYSADKALEISCFYSAFEATRSTDYSFSGESHDFWELLYVIDGSVVASADDRVFKLGKNDIIFHKPMELHKYHAADGTEPHLFIMSFSSDSSIMSSFQNLVMHLNDVQKKYFSLLIDFARSIIGGSVLYEVSFVKLLSNNPHNWQFFISLAELFLLSCTKNKPDNASKTLQTPKTAIFQKTVKIMENNICGWISVPQIAKEANVSVSYLKNIFNHYAGMGIHKYFLKSKINYSCILLEDGATVAETAEKLCFSSQNYFSMVFKREMKLSPTEYKKSRI